MGAVYHQTEQGSPHAVYSQSSPQHPPNAHAHSQDQRVIYEATPVSDHQSYRSSPVTYTSLANSGPPYKEEFVVSNGTVQKITAGDHRGGLMLAEPNVVPTPTVHGGHSSPHHIEHCATPTQVTELTPVQPPMYGQPPSFHHPHIQITLQQQYQPLRGHSGPPGNAIMSSEDVERYLNNVEQPPSSTSTPTSHHELTQLTPSTLSHNYNHHQFDYPGYLPSNFPSRGIQSYYSPNPSPVSWTPGQDSSQPTYNSSALQSMTQRYGYPPTADLGARGTGSSPGDAPSSYSSGAGTRSPSGLVNYSGYQAGGQEMGGQVQNGRADWPLTHLLTSGGGQPGSMSPPHRSTPAPEVRPGE